MAEDDVVIMVDSLSEPFDTTQAEPDRKTGGPVRIEPSWKREGMTAREAAVRPRRSDDDAVDELKGQLTAAQQRAAEADRRAAQSDAAARVATERVAQAHTVIADTAATALDSEINSATTESASLKQAYKAALDAGDFAKVADIQEQMADVRARLYDAKQRKGRLESGGEVSRPHQGAVREPPPATPSPEQIRQQRLSQFRPEARAWLENHPEVLDDPEKGSEAQVAHHRALKKGLVENSPEYFRSIEEHMGYTNVSRSAARERQDNGARRAERVESAPVDRGGTGGDRGGNGQPMRVELTRGEVEAANSTVLWNPGPGVPKEMVGKPVGVKEYARRKALMTQEGFYDARDVR